MPSSIGCQLQGLHVPECGSQRALVGIEQPEEIEQRKPLEMYLPSKMYWKRQTAISSRRCFTLNAYANEMKPATHIWM